MQLSMRVQIIVAVSVVASYMFIGGLNMARYDRLHDPKDCELLLAEDGYRSWSYRDCLKDNDSVAAKNLAGLGWPIYILFFIGYRNGRES